MWCMVKHRPYLLPATECIFGTGCTTNHKREPEFTLRSSRSHSRDSSSRSSMNRNTRIVTTVSSDNVLTGMAGWPPSRGSNIISPASLATTSKTPSIAIGSCASSRSAPDEEDQPVEDTGSKSPSVGTCVEQQSISASPPYRRQLQNPFDEAAVDWPEPDVSDACRFMASASVVAESAAVVSSRPGMAAHLLPGPLGEVDAICTARLSAESRKRSCERMP
mmetsp:Transcript_113985/g.329250  ORF Transcript_113985/g.329250 Transcript_113985/m.329250 type:complete len:220 (+) Transcript_113985:583-1242(+)